MQHTNRPTKSLRIFETEVAIPPSYGFANRAYKSARLQRKCRTRQDLPQNLKTIALWLTTYRRGPIMAAGPSEYCPRNSRADRHDRRIAIGQDPQRFLNTNKRWAVVEKTDSHPLAQSYATTATVPLPTTLMARKLCMHH